MFGPVNKTGVDLKLDLFVEDARGRQSDSTTETPEQKTEASGWNRSDQVKNKADSFS